MWYNKKDTNIYIFVINGNYLQNIRYYVKKQEVKSVCIGFRNAFMSRLNIANKQLIRPSDKKVKERNFENEKKH
jgi:hypothetical protein